MIKDSKEVGEADDWSKFQEKILAADISVIGTPIWLGVKLPEMRMASSIVPWTYR